MVLAPAQHASVASLRPLLDAEVDPSRSSEMLLLLATLQAVVVTLTAAAIGAISAVVSELPRALPADDAAVSVKGDGGGDGGGAAGAERSKDEAAAGGPALQLELEVKPLQLWLLLPAESDASPDDRAHDAATTPATAATAAPAATSPVAAPTATSPTSAAVSHRAQPSLLGLCMHVGAKATCIKTATQTQATVALSHQRTRVSVYSAADGSPITSAASTPTPTPRSSATPDDGRASSPPADAAAPATDLEGGDDSLEDMLGEVAAHLHLSVREGEAAQLTSMLQVQTPLSISLSPLQLRIVQEFAAATAAVMKTLPRPPPQPEPPPSATQPKRAPQGQMNVEVSISEGVEITLFGAQRRRLPLVSLRIERRTDWAGVTWEQQEGEARRTLVRCEFGTQLLAWSRAAQAWEPLLARTGCLVQAQQQGGGMWSVFCESEALELTFSDSMLRSLTAASEAASRVLAARTLPDALAEDEPQLKLQLINQSGCPLRCRVRGHPDLTVLQPGEQRSFGISEAGSQRSPLLSAVSLDAAGVWHSLPPFPSYKTGSWTLLATPPADAPPAALQGEPMALQVCHRRTSNAPRSVLAAACALFSAAPLNSTCERYVHKSDPACVSRSARCDRSGSMAPRSRCALL